MGQKLGKYELIKEIGKGAMGVVYLAFDPVIERQVAIKTMNDESFRDSEQRARFLREAKSAGGLQHPNIVTIFDMGESDGTPYIVMEFVEGDDLDELIKNDTLSLEDKINIMIQLCEALSFAHSQGIVHRDIKPSNIRILKDKKVKVMDFGIAKKQDSDLTRTGLVVGTISYMSPEQIQGKPVSAKSDQFSAGTVFFQLMTGKKPFEGENITSVIFKIISLKPDSLDMTGVSVFLSNVIKKMMANETENRFSDCNEVSKVLKAELNSLGSGQNEVLTTIMDAKETNPQLPPIPKTPNTAINKPPTKQQRQRKKKSNLGIIIGLVLVIFFVGGSAGGFYLYKKYKKFKNNIALHDKTVTELVKQPIESQELNNNDEPTNNSKTEVKADKQVVNEEDAKTKETLVDNKEEKKESNILVKNSNKLQENTNLPEKNKAKNVNKTKVQSTTVEKHSKGKPAKVLKEKEVFVKKDNKRVILQDFQAFQEFQKKINRTKKQALTMPIVQRKGKGNMHFNKGRRFMGNKAYKPAAFNFYIATIYDTTNSHAYANLVICLEKLKAYKEANKAIEKAQKNGVSVAIMMENIMFKDSYEKVIANR